MSLFDLGYRNVGLDDGWQDCHSGEASEVGMHYHDRHGNPVVNLKRFPSLKQLVRFGHSLNLTVGWYVNNCMCNDQCRNSTECTMKVHGDVDALLIKYNFDSVRIDACGNETSLGLAYWYDTIISFKEKQDYHTDDDTHDVIIENCRQLDRAFKPNRSLVPPYDCPYDYYRTSKDIRNNYGSVMSNLQTVFPYHDRNESWPGCWAYPDMLMVGVPPMASSKSDNGTGYVLRDDVGLNVQEMRSHFGSWAIISSPLILSHNVSKANEGENTTMTAADPTWNINSNLWIIRINQAYMGDSGGPFYRSNQTIRLLVEGKFYDDIPSVQYLYKPIGKGTISILLMNSSNATETLLTKFRDVPYNDCGAANNLDLKENNSCSYDV